MEHLTQTAPNRPLKGKKLSTAIDAAFRHHADGVQINVMDLGALFREVSTAYAAGESVDGAMVAAVAKYRKN